MKLADLAPSVIEVITTLRYDRIIEKHEGPARWSAIFAYYDLEILSLDGFNSLGLIEKTARSLLHCARLSTFGSESNYLVPCTDVLSIRWY